MYQKRGNTIRPVTRWRLRAMARQFVRASEQPHRDDTIELFSHVRYRTFPSLSPSASRVLNFFIEDERRRVR